MVPIRPRRAPSVHHPCLLPQLPPRDPTAPPMASIKPPADMGQQWWSIEQEKVRRSTRKRKTPGTQEDHDDRQKQKSSPTRPRVPSLPPRATTRPSRTPSGSTQPPMPPKPPRTPQPTPRPTPPIPPPADIGQQWLSNEQDEELKWKDCIQKKDVKAARKKLDLDILPGPEELQLAVNIFTYSNEAREIVKDICQRIEILVQDEHEEIEYIQACFKHDDPKKYVIFVIKTSKPTTIRSRYPWYVVEENNEEAIKEMECENRTEYQSEEMFQRACECLRIKSPGFMKAHSNLTSTSVSPVKLRKLQTPEKAVCIVFYVEVKGYIPIGEHILPKQIKFDDDTTFVTDVREGQCATALAAGPCDKHEDLKIGCRISPNKDDEGTLGCFLNHRKYGLCAISCAHVLLTFKDFCEIYQSKKSIESLGTIKCYQPFEPYSCGEICDIRLFEESSNGYGMDIALFKVDEERKPKTTAFPGVATADGSFSPLIKNDTEMRYCPGSVMQDSKTTKMTRSSTEVVKYGMNSYFTSAKYEGYGRSVRLKLEGQRAEADRKKRSGIFQYSLNDQIEIRDLRGHFSKRGDSGAMVFVRDERKGLIALGILTGRNERRKETYVTPIWNILEEIEMPLPYVLAEPI